MAICRDYWVGSGRRGDTERDAGGCVGARWEWMGLSAVAMLTKLVEGDRGCSALSSDVTCWGCHPALLPPRLSR